jgi:DNA-binding PadR family transcriptional regulator
MAELAIYLLYILLDPKILEKFNMQAYASHQHRCAPGRRGWNVDLNELVAQMTGRGHGHSRPHERGGPFGREGFGFAFGEGPFGPFGPGRRRGRKARRGDVRTAALILLGEEPRNGYQIMQELEERSDGLWRPSPGSVYPALQQLEDEGLVRSEEIDGRKVLRLTEAGEAELAKRPADAPAPWEEFTRGVSNDTVELAGLMKEVAFAFAQVLRVGGASQQAEAKVVLADTRRALYRILAEGEDEGEADESPAGPEGPTVAWSLLTNGK